MVGQKYGIAFIWVYILYLIDIRDNYLKKKKKIIFILFVEWVYAFFLSLFSIFQR